jgi:hypothetical protein
MLCSIPYLFCCYYFRKLQNRLGGKEVLKFYQEAPKYNFNFCYLNCNKNYLINQIDQLFKGEQVTMFTNGEQYIIHKKNEPCGTPDSDVAETSSTHQLVLEFIKDKYPKQRYLSLIFDILKKHELFDENLFCIPFPNIHIADVCSFFLNRFSKNENQDVRMLKFCKFLQKKGLNFLE